MVSGLLPEFTRPGNNAIGIAWHGFAPFLGNGMSLSEKPEPMTFSDRVFKTSHRKITHNVFEKHYLAS
jgi:hypothetical protein